MGTQAQKDQLISLVSTRFNPVNVNKDRFQIFITDPENCERFGEFINSYERWTYPPIFIANLAPPKFPDWAKGRVLTGEIREPVVIDFTVVTACVWFHPHQTEGDISPTGHDILATLVASYILGQDKDVSSTYKVVAKDAIHGQFGLKELVYLETNWKSLPKPFTAWAKRKLLYGWRDVFRNADGGLSVPCLRCDAPTPFVGWCHLDFQWHDYEPALREQVSPQT